eukprot:UN03784
MNDEKVLQSNVMQNDSIYKERVMMKEDRIQAEYALFNVFLMIMTFSALYIGIQFWWQLQHGTFGGAVIAVGVVLVVVKIVMKNNAKHEAVRRVEMEMMHHTQVGTQVVVDNQ